MRVVRSIIVRVSLLAGILAGATTAAAGPNANAKILFHMLPYFHPPCLSGRTVCRGINTNGKVGMYPQVHGQIAYLLVTDGNPMAGIAGIEVGLDYNPGTNAGVEDPFWSLC